MSETTCSTDCSEANLAADDQTNIRQLRLMVERFVDQRQWQVFHSPKNLSMALAIEAAELMEHFQWLTTEASREIGPDKLVEIGEELADVFCYTLALSNQLGLDLTSTFVRKMQLNAIKYPADQFRGRFGPQDPGQ